MMVIYHQLKLLIYSVHVQLCHGVQKYAMLLSQMLMDGLHVMVFWLSGRK